MPILLKGVQRVEDVIRAVEIGISDPARPFRTVSRVARHVFFPLLMTHVSQHNAYPRMEILTIHS